MCQVARQFCTVLVFDRVVHTLRGFEVCVRTCVLFSRARLCSNIPRNGGKQIFLPRRILCRVM